MPGIVLSFTMDYWRMYYISVVILHGLKTSGFNLKLGKNLPSVQKYKYLVTQTQLNKFHLSILITKI